MVATVLATGEPLVGAGVRAFEPVMEDLIRAARREIQIAAYRFDESALPLLDLLKEAVRRGVRVTLVVNAVAAQPPAIRAFLVRILEEYPECFKLRDFSRARRGLLHAKVLVVDRQSAVIGSANFTWGGLVSNCEIGVLVEGECAWRVSRLIDVLADGRLENPVAAGDG